MFESRHRSVGRIRERGESTGGRERAVVVACIGGMRAIPALVVTGGDAPGVWCVAWEFLWVLDAIFEIDAGKIATIFEIVREAIARMRVECHVGVVREKERTTGTDADVKLDSKVGVAVCVVV